MGLCDMENNNSVYCVPLDRTVDAAFFLKSCCDKFSLSHTCKSTANEDYFKQRAFFIPDVHRLSVTNNFCRNAHLACPLSTSVIRHSTFLLSGTGLEILCISAHVLLTTNKREYNRRNK